MFSSICTLTYVMSNGYLSKCDKMTSSKESSPRTCSETELCAEDSSMVELIFNWMNWPANPNHEGGSREINVLNSLIFLPLIVLVFPLAKSKWKPMDKGISWYTLPTGQPSKENWEWLWRDKEKMSWILGRKIINVQISND